jgi:tetratricopeptide (TPR) repeat protein
MALTKIQHLFDILERARENDDPEQTARVHFTLGKTYLAEGLYHEAETHFHQSSQDYHQAGDRYHAALALNQSATAMLMNDHPQKALDTFQEALALTSEQDPDALHTAIQGNLGLVHAALGEFVQAVRYHKKVHETGLQNNDQTLQLQALIHLSDTYLQEKRLQQALGFGLVAHDLALERSDSSALAVICDTLGMIYARKRALPAAIEYHQKAVEYAQKAGNLQQQAQALANQALALEMSTRLQEALTALESALTIFKQLNSPQIEKTQNHMIRIKTALVD